MSGEPELAESGAEFEVTIPRTPPRAIRGRRSPAPTGGAMKSILDPSFRYVPSASTDLRKTFSRVRRELQRAAAQSARADAVAATSPHFIAFNRSKDTATAR